MDVAALLDMARDRSFEGEWVDVAISGAGIILPGPYGAAAGAVGVLWDLSKGIYFYKYYPSISRIPS